MQRGADQRVRFRRRRRVSGRARQARQVQRLREPLQVKMAVKEMSKKIFLGFVNPANGDGHSIHAT